MKPFVTTTFAAVATCFLLGNKGARGDIVDDFGPFQGTYVLEDTTGYKVSWGVANGAITLLLESSSIGWLGFGFGEPNSGSMIGADIVTYEPSDSSVTDWHVDWSAYPISPFPSKDGCQNWELMTAVIDFSGDIPIRQVVVKRSLQTEDDNDRDISSGATRIVFAYGGNDDSSIQYHGARRGAAVIDFFKGNEQFQRYISGDEEWLISPLPDETSNATFVMPSYVVPNDTNTYTTIYFDVSEHKNKGVIAIEPVINKATKDLVHHMILHICRNVEHTVPQVTPSLMDNQNCPAIMFSWAVGSGALILPDDASFTGQETLALEIHYNNAAGESNQIDSSGFRLHYATEPRIKVASVIAVGDPFVRERAPVTRGTESKWFQYQCAPGCTQKMTNPSVQVIASFLHMHSYGRQMWSAHYSSELELKEVTNEVEFWQFEYQQMTPVNYTLSRGDTITVDCVYDTSKSAVDVEFGYDTEDEMCMEFLLVIGDVPEKVGMCGGEIFPHSICVVDGQPQLVGNPAVPRLYPREVLFGSSEKVCTEKPTDLIITQEPTKSTGDGSIGSLGMSVVLFLGTAMINL